MKTAAEYRVMADKCFKWAHNTYMDEAREGARAREKSLKNFDLVPLRWRRSDCIELDPSPLCCQSCRRRSWSGWGGIDQRDSIIDLRAAAGVKKRTSEARTGSKPNSIGAEHNEAIGRRMTHHTCQEHDLTVRKFQRIVMSGDPVFIDLPKDRRLVESPSARSKTTPFSLQMNDTTATAGT